MCVCVYICIYMCVCIYICKQYAISFHCATTWLDVNWPKEVYADICKGGFVR